MLTLLIDTCSNVEIFEIGIGNTLKIRVKLSIAFNSMNGTAFTCLAVGSDCIYGFLDVKKGALGDFFDYIVNWIPHDIRPPRDRVASYCTFGPKAEITDLASQVANVSLYDC